MTTPMINLLCDYNYVAHPAILQALQAHMDDKFVGYALDDVSDQARAAILDLVQHDQAEVHFVTGGTQANFTAISAFLRPHEAVIAPASGHIAQHETGAIEATGHKVLTFEAADGKVIPSAVRHIVDTHINEHMVKPRMVYLSQTTEYGTVYTLGELRALRETCNELGLLMYMDGARLGCALTADKCDFTLPQIAQLFDAFYIGGTKNGTLYGEAMVVCNPSLQEDFRYLIKQRGGMLGKGFLMGIQFKAIFEDGLYFQLAEQGNTAAKKLDAGLRALGYDFELETESNQLFPIIANEDIARLAKHIIFNEWNPLEGDRTSIRFVTSWKTTDDEIQAVLGLMDKRTNK